MSQQFYQVGGSLPADAQSYIKREADDKLYDYLKEGKYCYVLNARQVGKSSLRVHTSKRLLDDGYSCVNIDLTSIGSEGITVDDWYFSFISYVIEQLNLDEDEFIEWWDNNEKLTIVNRFAKIFDRFILKETTKNIVIFIDEIDSVLGINKFSTDNFFAVIRTFFNLRSENRCYTRLSFALFGVATAEDLMRDSSRTPFNVAHSVEIKQFLLSESHSLVDGLDNQTIDKNRILEKIFEWTSGTPYLTQKLLYYISSKTIESLDEIDKAVDTLFIKENFKEINLNNIQNRIINNEMYNVQMLYMIRKLQNNEIVRVDSCNLSCAYLKLSGLAKDENGILKYRNKIYETIFNESWQNKVIAKIDKPFARELKKWLDLNRLNSALLKGKALKQAKYWAKHNQVNNIESEYIRISSHEAYRKFIYSILTSFMIIMGVSIYYHEKSIVWAEKKCNSISCQTEVPKTEVSNRYTLKSIRGKTIHIQTNLRGLTFSEYKGKIVILEMFGKDCPHCINMIPIIKKIRKRYRGKLEVIAIQSQDRMSKSTARNYINRYRIKYPIIEGEDAVGLQRFIQDKYDWTGILPYTLIIKGGRIESLYSLGEFNFNDMKRDIDSLF